MKGKFLFITVIVGAFLLFVSWIKNQNSINGVAVLRTKVWNDKLKKYVSQDHTADMKIWYKDSCLIYHTTPTICEVMGEDTTYVNDVGKTLDMYTFQNGHSMLWEYTDFSAAARMRMSAQFNDSVGWSVNNLVALAFEEDVLRHPMESLPDTVIDHVLYKRVKNESIRLWQDPEEDEYTVIGYMRCDKKDLPFRLNKRFDDKMGCILTRIEYKINNRSPWFLIELDFQADQLSADEVSIFNSWEKNAKEDLVFIAQSVPVKDSLLDFSTPPGPIPVRDSFTFCGVKYKIPRNCRGESQGDCCSAMTSPDQLSCHNGTGLFWHYMPTEESAKLHVESLPSQWTKQTQKFSAETIDCYLAGKPVKAYRTISEKSNGDTFHCLAMYGSVNGQVVVAQLRSQKELKTNKDIQPVFQQIIKLKE